MKRLLTIKKSFFEQLLTTFDFTRTHKFLMLLKSTHDMSGFFILIEIFYLKLQLSIICPIKSMI